MHSQGFPPIARSDARLLILGSLPGAESLRQRRYYAQPRNHFWRIMGELCGAGPELDYEERARRLQQHGIALWDVCAAAYREGSLDSSIDPATIEVNDFAAFYAAHAGIARVCCNGSTSFDLYRRRVLPTLPSPWLAIAPVRLPSTSPAHAAMSYEQKLARWRELLALSPPAVPASPRGRPRRG
jgi:hypoxanthine-DNA glycosylase